MDQLYQDFERRLRELEISFSKQKGRMMTHEAITEERYNNIMQRLDALSPGRLVIMFAIIVGVIESVLKFL